MLNSNISREGIHVIFKQIDELRSNDELLPSADVDRGLKGTKSNFNLHLFGISSQPKW